MLRLLLRSVFDENKKPLAAEIQRTDRVDVDQLYEELENILKQQGILNVNACIAYPQAEDEYLTKDSVLFHEKLGYTMVGTFHQCGYKFHRWYDMVWMEKFIGEHRENQPDIIPFPELKMEK